jgi:hypothetical protein
MQLDSVRAVVRALDGAGVRFLVAGGLAVNAHGYLRFTKDLDLVVHLSPENIRATFVALAKLGYQPVVPLTADQMADPALRNTLVREKGMQVLQFWSDDHRETPVDLFVTEPFPFDEEDARAMVKSLDAAGPVRVVSRATLIRMKEATGRAQDRIDVEHLRLLERP